MKVMFRILAGLALFLFSSSVPAAELPGCAVMTFEAKNGVSKEESAVLADGLESELIQLKQYRMVSRANLVKVLEAQKISLECAGTECAIEAGKIAALRYVVFGSVGKVGETYSLVANLADSETGVIEKTAKVMQSGKIDDLLRYGVGSAARQLMGVAGGAVGATATRAEAPAMAGGGADLADLMAQVQASEAEAKRLEAARVAAQQRLAEELARRKSRFEKDYADYVKIAQSPHAEEGVKRTAWQRLCAAWGVTGGEKPAGLAWDEKTGLLKVVELGGGGGGRTGEAMTVDLGNGEKLELVWIEPGSFMMGSPTGEEGHQNDEVQHRVTLSKGFWMGKYEVTQGQWERVMGNNPAKFKGARNPVEQVSWEDCQAFIQKLNEVYGSTVQGSRFRLPTEAEWEYACRAGTTGPYAGSLDELGWYGQNSGISTHPVGQKKPNAWGLYDMHGNVWEWCQAWYGDYPTGNVTDPTGPGSGDFRVVRGGGWFSPATDARCAIRNGNRPAFRGTLDGARVVVSPRP